MLSGRLGLELARIPHADRHGGSPAHAGMDLSLWIAASTPSRLPRPRGDGPFLYGMAAFGFMPPPPTRDGP